MRTAIWPQSQLVKIKNNKYSFKVIICMSSDYVIPPTLL